MTSKIAALALALACLGTIQSSRAQDVECEPSKDDNVVTLQSRDDKHPGRWLRLDHEGNQICLIYGKACPAKNELPCRQNCRAFKSEIAENVSNWSLHADMGIRRFNEACPGTTSAYVKAIAQTITAIIGIIATVLLAIVLFLMMSS